MAVLEAQPGRAVLGRSLGSLFAEEARRRPAATAIDTGTRQLTYGEFDRLSVRLARRLVALGVGPGVRVALFLRWPEEVVGAMLAVARAGGAYVPIDPAYPSERVAFLLEDSGAAVVLAAEDLLPLASTRVLRLGPDLEPVEPGAEAPLPEEIPPESLAFLIYTSGSTGSPKGVALPHRGVVRLVRETDYLQLGPGDRVALAANVAFDAVSWEVWGALLNGGCLVPIERETLLSPLRLAAALRERRVTALFLTTALFHQVARALPQAFSSLSSLLFGGEASDPASVRRVLAAGPPGRLLHVYGPTENSTFTTWEQVREVSEGAATVPIGRPIAHTETFVVGSDLSPVAPGETGELWIGGAGLALGYWNRPEATAERFIPSPWGPTGERLYRSGDRVRLRVDGRLEFVGRLDRQVKIRGFRIEPGEVEAALAGHPAVREAAVHVREDEPGERRLVAYAVGEPGGPSGADLRAFLAERLPAHLLPAAVVLLPRMPLNANGKIDRAALPPPVEADEASHATGSPLEDLLAGIWAEVLGRRPVEPDEDFFALGGHSLAAIRMIARVRESCGVDLPLEALFDEPTVAGLARRVEAALGSGVIGAMEAPALTAGEREGDLPLTFAQERLWLLDRANPGSALYNLPLLLRLDGPLVPAALEAALAALVERHESLRTVFAEVDGRPVQVVKPAEDRPLPRIDLRALPPERRERELALRVAEEGERPFDLRRGPLLRLHLFTLDESAHALLAVAHHIVADGWSLGIFQEETAALYEASLGSLPPLPVQIPDLALWERRHLDGPPLAVGLAYWRERLAGLPRLDLPADRPRPESRGDAGTTLEFALPDTLAATLPRLARQEGTTLFLALLAAFAAFLHRTTGSADLAVGTPVVQRDRPEVEGLIGFLVNTLVVRMDLQGDPTFADLLARVRASVLAAHAHREVPFERLVAELRPARRPDENPLVQAVFSVNPPVPPVTAAGVRFYLQRPRTRTAKFDLALEILGEAPDLRCFWEYPRALFEPATVARLAAGFAELLRDAAAHPLRPLSELALLGESARHQVLQEWNDTTTAYPSQATVHGLFTERVTETLDARAIVASSGTLTYGELDRRARRLAARLLRLGVGPDVRVGICLERGIEMVVAFVAVLQAGGAYLPLDPSHPAERLAFMLADGNARTLLTRPGLFPGSPSLPVLDVRETEQEPVGEEREPGATADHLAYVIYTSGSTGKPKGIAVPHRAVVRLVRETDYVVFTREDRVGQIANASFDAATFEIWGALLNGGTLVILDRETTLSPVAFAHAVAEEQVSALFLTTALFNVIANADPSCFAPLTHLLVGGEAVDPTRVAAVLAAHPPARLLDAYGPTESTTFATTQRITAVPAGARNLPIGRPIANTRAFNLGAGLAPVPAGGTGELYLGGDGLARSYTDPALTAERFVPAPPLLGEPPGARLYRTGDLVRQSADGALTCLGRTDTQVKVRGFRVEPGEVEAVLGAHPEIAECAVLARQAAGGEMTLAAYLAAQATLAPETLRAWLLARLPEPMVPATFVLLPALPRNANGKLDRAALRDVGGSQEELQVLDGAPRTPVEEILCGIWAELLEQPAVGIHDDFFSLGGHSLLGTRLLARVRQVFGLDVSLRALFDQPTITALAARIASPAGSPGAHHLQPLPPDGPETVHPLAPAQRRLWFLAQLAPGGAFLHVPTALALRGPLSVTALEAALGRIVDRHEPLRTTFHARVGGAVQRISPPAGLPLPSVDLSGLLTTEAEARRLLAAFAERPFDLERGPVARALLLRLASEEHRLALVVHHLCFDGGSVAVLDRELSALYPTFSQRETPGLPPLPARYVEIAAWQRERLADATQQRAAWRRQLEGLVPLVLPTDHPRPATPRFRGGFLTTALPRAATAGLESLCRRQGVTPFMALLALFQTLLARWSGQTDFAVGAPISGRTLPESEGLIGFFVNTLVLRADLSGDPDFPTLLARTRRTALAAYAHGDLPFEALVLELRPDRQAGVNPLFETMFSLQEARRPPRLPGLDAAPLFLEAEIAPFDLTLLVTRSPECSIATLNHRDLFDRTTALRLLDGWTALLAAALERPGSPVLDLPLLRPAERHQAAIEWNDTAEPTPYLPLDLQIAAHAARGPDALAITGEGRQLSYGELERRSRRLAYRLLSQGLPPEGKVALRLPRGPELAIAALAVLRAGGVYLPLDPDIPPDRLDWIVQDAGAFALLSEIPQVEGEADTPGTPAIPPPAPERLAYTIYTSGSTGTPKGVELPHDGLGNLIAWYLATYDLIPGDRVGLMASPGFDASVFELWPSLAVGASLHAPPRATLASPRELTAWLAAEAITVCFLPTPLAEALLRTPLPVGLALRILQTAGDRLHQGPPSGFPAALVNLYGPTESTVAATATWVEAGAALPPIGRPISNFEAHLLGPDLRPVPPGATGELCLGGRGLARGYAGRPDWTAERFVPHPGPAPAGARLYRTGDLVRFRRDGALDFLGRADHQVKVRGVRIEPGEIEARLEAHPAIASAAVSAIGESSGTRLVAFFLPRPGAAVPAADLRAHLRRSLPEAMVPAAFIPLAAWPLTSQGKLDRAALASLAAQAPPAEPGLAPKAGLEQSIARLWSEVLGGSAVGRDDNFFDLGGHSLVLAALQERLEAELGRRLPVVELFENPTVRSLAAHLAAAEAPPEPARSEEIARRAARERQAAGWKERMRGARRRP